MQASGITGLTDTIEAAAWADLFRAAPPAARATLGLEVLEEDGEVLLVARHAPHPMLNRAIGVRPHAAEIGRAVGAFRARKVPRFFLHLYRGQRNAEVERAMAGARLVPYRRAWVKLLRGTGPVPAPVTDLALGPARPEEAAKAGRLFAAAFDLPEAVAALVAAVVGRPRWDVLVARERGRPVAVGLLFSDGGAAYLAGGATAPGARGRGAQGALVAARIRRALDAGCAWIVSETGEAVPGDPQHSYRNLVRCGLAPVGLRDNWTPAT